MKIVIDIIAALIGLWGLASIIVKVVPPMKDKNILLPIVKLLDKIVTRKKALTK